jgi:hypothetical protein
MIHNFHPREVFSNISTERMIGEVNIKGGNKEGITLSYRGWSLLFCDQKVQIEKENHEKGRECPKYLIIAKEKMKRPSSFSVLSIYQTGAITITIDPEGNLRMRGFLKKNLNVHGA